MLILISEYEYKNLIGSLQIIASSLTENLSVSKGKHFSDGVKKIACNILNVLKVIGKLTLSLQSKT